MARKSSAAQTKLADGAASLGETKNAFPVDQSAISHSWRAWVEAHACRCLLFARDQTRCEADAQDVLQEALIETWQRCGGKPPDAPLVFATIRRRAIDLARSNDRRLRREQASPDWFYPPAESAARDEDLEQAVKTLPPSLREVLVLKVWSGLTFQEIAATVGIPANTAASRYRYALERLRASLKEASL
jgi:RNA polymerase sigma-70 factor (ECF subfamily)